jgi:hypothetical protein
MNALSVNSISNTYVRTAVAQQRVSVDRGNVLETEAQLNEYQAQLDEDLTYLAKLQHKNQDIQQLEGTQAQSSVLERIGKNAQSAQQAAQSAGAALFAALSASSGPKLGTNINVVA